MDLMDLFNERLVKVCAPMVRYSKLPFRLLVREYNCDVAFTPMIIADSFVRSEKCRQVEFSTNDRDSPLIVQFAAKTPEEFVGASEYIYKHSSGIDLNCGCPQRWAIQEGIGACLLSRPEVVADILRQTRNRIPNSNFHVSVKIRILPELSHTIDMVRQLESAGISFLTVHGRTINERCQPVHLDIVKNIVDSVSIPVIANGDIDSIAKATLVQESTGVKGVMSARAILTNPALFSGYDLVPAECIKRWLEINLSMNSHFTLFHKHLIHMTEDVFTKAERKVFNTLTTRDDVVSFLCQRFGFTIEENLLASNLNSSSRSALKGDGKDECESQSDHIIVEEHGLTTVRDS